MAAGVCGDEPQGHWPPAAACVARSPPMFAPRLSQEVAAYKLQIRSKQGLEWQPGEDRKLELPAQAATVEVLAAWGAPKPEVKVLELAAAAAEAAALIEPEIVEEATPAAGEQRNVQVAAEAAAAAAADAPAPSATHATPEEDYGFLEDLTIKARMLWSWLLA